MELLKIKGKRKEETIEKDERLKKADYATIGTKAGKSAPLPLMFPAPLLGAAKPPKIRLSGIIVGRQRRVISGGAPGAQRS
jgi:hypothetical protein